MVLDQELLDLGLAVGVALLRVRSQGFHSLLVHRGLLGGALGGCGDLSRLLANQFDLDLGGSLRDVVGYCK